LGFSILIFCLFFVLLLLMEDWGGEGGGGGGCSSHSRSIFKIQKRINVGITGCSNRDSCCELLKNLVVIPHHSQYIFSLLLFIKNREFFRSTSDVHNINTRYHSDLHLLVANFWYFKRQFLILELELLTNFHHLSKIYQMMWNSLD